MGRTDQVLTISTAVQKPIRPGSFTLTMKAVLVLLLVCLIKISLAEERDASGDASSEINVSLQREVREAARKCKKGDKKCQTKVRKERRRNKKSGRKVRKSKAKKGKKEGNGARKKSTRKLDGKKKPKATKKKQKNKSRKERRKGTKGLNGLRSSPTSGNGRSSSTCFTDLVAKTKKFNKAQVEFRLAKRVQSWGKLMKNKKSNSASTFADALEAMNEATGNGKKCEGDSSSFAEAKKVREKLANCSVSAGANCDEGKLATPINSSLVSSCKLLWRPLLRTLR